MVCPAPRRLFHGRSLRSLYSTAPQKRLKVALTVADQSPNFDVGQGIALCTAPDLQGGGLYAQKQGGLNFCAKRVRGGLMAQSNPSHYPDNTQRVSFRSVKEFQEPISTIGASGKNYSLSEYIFSSEPHV